MENLPINNVKYLAGWNFKPIHYSAVAYTKLHRQIRKKQVLFYSSAMNESSIISYKEYTVFSQNQLLSFNLIEENGTKYNKKYTRFDCNETLTRSICKLQSVGRYKNKHFISVPKEN